MRAAVPEGSVFLIAGTDKADPLHQVLEGAPNSDLYPSQLVKPAGGSLVFFVDRAAAAKLTTADGGKE